MKILITGANRGLGLEFTRQYLALGDDVIACYRKDKGGLEQLANCDERLRSIQLDITHEDSPGILSETLGGSCDLCINNAGVYPHADLSQTRDAQNAWLHGMLVNCISPVIASFQLASNMTKNGKIVFISSKMGSIEDNTSGGSYLYRSSKAALNAAVKSLAIDLKPSGISVVTLHPGWVKTDMGGPNALIDAQTSVANMIKRIEELNLENTGRFLTYDGEEVPW